MPTWTSLRSADLRAGLLFCAPWIVGFLLLFAWPFFASLYWSFCRYDLINSPEWIGTEHDQRLGSETVAGEGFGLALTNTLYYSLLSVPLSVIAGAGGLGVARRDSADRAFAPEQEVADVRAWMFDSAERLSVYDDRLFGVCNGHLFTKLVDLAGSENQFPVPVIPGAAMFKRTVESAAYEAMNEYRKLRERCPELPEIQFSEIR